MARHSTMATPAQAKTKRLWYLEETICSGTGLINVLLMRLDCRASHHENRATSRRDRFPHTATVPVKTAISLSTPSPSRQHRELAAFSSPHTSRICETLATPGQREGPPCTCCSSACTPPRSAVRLFRVVIHIARPCK